MNKNLTIFNSSSSKSKQIHSCSTGKKDHCHLDALFSLRYLNCYGEAEPNNMKQHFDLQRIVEFDEMQDLKWGQGIYHKLAAGSVEERRPYACLNSALFLFDV